MSLEELVASAAEQGASDVHLEPGLPPALRIRGVLKMSGTPVDGTALVNFARSLIPADAWEVFSQKRSYDMSRVVRGVRCRINVLHTARGVGMAVRLLSNVQLNLRKLNLHPDLKKLVQSTHGLVLISGPTGSGKTSTLAALVQEINASEPRHIVTIESPIEYTFRPQQSFIRQREVGRDTPSFNQALHDALREDPDVLMVGEMRDPETMQLTLHASETGHLVLATVHSSSCAEALQRVVGAFPAEVQASVCAQLADCLVGVVAQRLRYRPELKLRVPECEVLIANSAVKANVRAGQFFKIPSSIETGGSDGMWTFARYKEWLDGRTDWYVPDEREAMAMAPEPPVPVVIPAPSAAPPPPSQRYVKVSDEKPAKARPATRAPAEGEAVFELDEVEENPLDILRQLEGRKQR